MATSPQASSAGARPGSSRTVPAVILVSDANRAALRVASLTLLDRLMVAIHRAGAGPITIVCNGALPQLKRTPALGIPFLVSPEIPHLPGPVLLASAELLVQTGDVRRCLESGARLLDLDNAPLPIGLVSSPRAEVEPMLPGLAALRAEGIALKIDNPAAARQAEKLLWASLASSSDGTVDRYFNRPCGRPLSKLLIHTPVSPNMVSIASVLIGLAAAALFATGQYPTALIGAFLFQISAIIDCVDGDIARVVFKESPLGKWIDLVGDQVVHASVFAAIAFGLYRSEASSLALWLGASAVLGGVISFGVILRGLSLPAHEHGPLKKLIDAATNRDFSVLVLFLAVIGKLKIFLWLAAIGSHVFWMAALGVQLSVRSRCRD